MPASQIPTSPPLPSSTAYDAVVVGGGIVGACCAYRLARRGLKVLLLEAHDALHRKGSSHGESRIVRPTYPEEHYTRMMRTAYDLWREAQAEAGTSVFRHTGGLDMGPKGSKDMLDIVESCNRVGVPYVQYDDADSLAARCPGVSLPRGYVAVVNDDAGYVHATKSVAMFLDLARRNGAAVRDRCRVSRIAPLSASNWNAGGGVEVVYSYNDAEATGPITHVVHARCVCVCAGAWCGDLLNNVGSGGVLETARWTPKQQDGSKTTTNKLSCLPLPLQPIATSVCYWRLKQGVPRELYSAGALPVFICYDTKYADDRTPQCYGIYGFPCSDADMPGCVKACLHSGPPLTRAGVEGSSPAASASTARTLAEYLDTKRNALAHPPSVAQVVPFLSSVLPGVECAAGPAHQEGCMYTMTPDHDFIVDRLVEERPSADAAPSTLVAIACGFSGHGFKLAPFIGERLADLCLGGEVAARARDELHVFRMERFGTALTPEASRL